MSIPTEPLNFTICICTYQRAGALTNLLDDIFKQTIHPGTVVIIDGDPSSGEVKAFLVSLSNKQAQQFVYIPSNHANLSYQRYLGWKIATERSVSFLLYLDDDLRLFNKDAIENLLSPLLSDPTIVGVTTLIRMGTPGENYKDHPALFDRLTPPKYSAFWTKVFGSSKGIPSGGLTPMGDRVVPVRKVETTDYSIVEWLRGGVMLYRMNAINEDCFSHDLFALDHIRCGKGEDTFLSRQVMRNGKLAYHHDVIIDHPNIDLPKTYPISAYHLAYASAYSRRFLNDHYRIAKPPYLSDRIALLKSYSGNNIINLLRAITHPARHRFAYAWGYFRGSIRGIFQKPTARKLTPHIDWWKDAEDALAHKVVIQ